MKCRICPRRCLSERTESENLSGYCRCSLTPRVARAALHFWEEPCISGSRGSGTVFFSGCSLGCCFCQNEEISHGCAGADISVGRLAEIFGELESMGAHNINLVSPTHYSLAIIEALNIYRPKIPIIWNSGGYETEETLKMLEPFIDVFLMDFKYFSSERAARYSAAADYPETAAAAIKQCHKMQPECIFDENGIIQKGVIVRHLLLPQGTADAIAVFKWTRNNAPGAYFSLMNQYVPCGRAAEDSIINRRVTRREYEKVLSVIIESGFENCYIQDEESAEEKYIPSFDLTGVKKEN